MRAWLLVGSCLFFLLGCATAGGPTAPASTSGTPAANGAGTEGERALEAYFAPTVAACGHGDAPSCSRLAQRLGTITSKREGQWLASALHAGCAAHVPVACAGEATALTHGVGVPRDAARGLELLRKACDAGQALACANLAEVYIAGKLDPSATAEQGRALARRACDTLGGWPCLTVMGELQPETDGARIAQLLQRACDGDDLTACYQLGMIYTDGGKSLPTPDLPRAKALYGKACDGGVAGACFNLALVTPTGRGAKAEEPPKPEELADRALLERACLLGDPSGCDTLARRDHDDAKYCERWGADACYAVAADIAGKRGETAESATDLVRAALRAADRGSYAGRNTLGHLFRDNARWCDAGQNVKDSCTFAGLLYAAEAEDGVPGAERDEAAKQAGAALDRACGAGSKPACDARARLGR